MASGAFAAMVATVSLAPARRVRGSPGGRTRRGARREGCAPAFVRLPRGAPAAPSQLAIRTTACAPAASVAFSMSDDNLGDMTYRDLQAVCKEEGVNAKG